MAFAHALLYHSKPAYDSVQCDTWAESSTRLCVTLLMNVIGLRCYGVLFVVLTRRIVYASIISSIQKKLLASIVSLGKDEDGL